jgi:GTP-binding protein Era
MNDNQTRRSGFIAVVGAPNAGKSTFVNKMVGAKVAIVTPKVQTTRGRILGITTHGLSQLIFIDTAGVFKPKANFEKAMVKSALSSIGEADVIALIIDAYKGLCDNTKIVLAAINQTDVPKILILNKVDKVEKAKLLTLAQEVFALGNFAHCFMISAMKGDGVNDVKTWLSEHLPIDEWHYPEDQLTDIPLRQWAAELTRESLFYRLKQELPYSITVETEAYEEKRKYSKATNGKNIREDYIAIRQIIYVQNDNQKKIILGKGGAMLKEIGMSARPRMEDFLGQKVHLELFVKVAENWKDDKHFYQSIGLE